MVWQRSLGGSGWDSAESIRQTSDGGYIVAGWTASTDGDVSGNHGGTDAWVVKLDGAGNPVWQRCLGGSWEDDAYSIQQTSDGGFIVAGGTESTDGDVSGNHGDSDVWVVKLPSPTPSPKPTSNPSGGGGRSTATETHSGSGALKVNKEGTVLITTQVNAIDGVGNLLLPIGTMAHDADGNPITEVSIEPSIEVPPVPAGATFQFTGYTYRASPAGATFDPAITLTLEIPEDVWNTLDLESEQPAVKWYNEEIGGWEDIPTTFDPNTRTVKATVTHFSTFALFTEPVEVAATPTETPTGGIPTTAPTAPATPAPGEERPAPGLPVTMNLAIFAVVVIIVAAGYFLLMRR